MSPSFLVLEVTRPLVGAVPIALALALVVLSFRRARSGGPARPLGTARFLPEAAGGGARGSRLDLPPSRILALGSLLVAGLALLGLTPAESTVGARVLRVLVDRSPSMYLPVDPGRPGGPTRMEAAARALVGAADGPWREELGRALVLEWEPVDRAFEVLGGGSLPAPFRTPPRSSVPAPRFVGADEPGCVWLTDAAPVRPTRAGLAASGGALVPGPVAWSREGALSWDGADALALTSASRVQPPEVVVRGVLEPGLAALARTWCEDRGALWRGAEGSGANPLHDGVQLVIRAPATGEAQPALVRGAGWEATGRMAEARGPWRVRPGAIDVALQEIVAGPDEPAAFALDFVAALDRALLPPPGVVALEERKSAGEPELHPPSSRGDDRFSDADAARARTARLIEALAGLIAALLALAAALVRARSGR